MPDEITRPIIGIEHRTAQEVFDIMCERFRGRLPSLPSDIDGLVEELEAVTAAVLYTCADCEEGGNYEGMCHAADNCVLLDGRVLCEDCYSDGHYPKGAPRIPDIKKSLDRLIAALRARQAPEGVVEAAFAALRAQPNGSAIPSRRAMEAAINAALSAMPSGAEVRGMDEFRNRVARWCIECFGETTASDVVERNWRFLEEALELVQSLGGKADDAHKLVDYVFARQKGDPRQEIGGTMVTLAALVAANNYSLGNAAWAELERIERPEIIEKIRAKHASKPHKSPLPGDYRYAGQSS